MKLPIPTSSKLLQSALFSGTTVLLLLASACASRSVMVSDKTDKDIAASGPTVVDARTDPETFELSRQLGPKGAEIIASVQDFDSRIKSVKLSFTHVPLEIPMTHVVGNTCALSSQTSSFRSSRVEGTTMRYEAYVMASDKDGKISASPKAVTIAVKAPELSDNG